MPNAEARPDTTFRPFSYGSSTFGVSNDGRRLRRRGRRRRSRVSSSESSTTLPHRTSLSVFSLPCMEAGPHARRTVTRERAATAPTTAASYIRRRFGWRRVHDSQLGITRREMNCREERVQDDLFCVQSNVKRHSINRYDSRLERRRSPERYLLRLVDRRVIFSAAAAAADEMAAANHVVSSWPRCGRQVRARL